MTRQSNLSQSSRELGKVEADLWREGMANEFDLLLGNGTRVVWA